MSKIDTPPIDAEVLALVAAKSAPAHRAAVLEEEAQAIAAPGATVLNATDLDGVRLPFIDDPEKCTMDRWAKRAIKDLGRLVNGVRVAITGGALARTRRIMGNEGFPDVELFSSYGAQRWVSDGAGGMTEQRVEYISPTQAASIVLQLDDAKAALERALKQLMHTDEVWVHSADEARTKGLLYFEPKDNLFAVQYAQGARGRGDLKEMLERAIDVLESNGTLRRLNLHRKPGNGTIEIASDLLPDKGTAIGEIRAKHGEPTVTRMDTDDWGDVPAAEAVNRLGHDADGSRNGRGFVHTVFHPPEWVIGDDGEPVLARPGTPVELLRLADVVHMSEADLGRHEVELVDRIWELNPALVSSGAVRSADGDRPPAGAF